MKRYKYRAIDGKQAVHTGYENATDLHDLIYKLYLKRLVPIEIESVSKTESKLLQLKQKKTKLESRTNVVDPLPERSIVGRFPAEKYGWDWAANMVTYIIYIVIGGILILAASFAKVS